jgi:hypothetical protein
MSARSLLCFTSFALVFQFTVAAPVSASGFDRADSHAPIGVMGDHTHAAGDVMLSYRYSRMHMDGNRSRTEDEGRVSILGPPPGRFPVVPTEMDMQMHMFGAMVAPHDRVTLMGMLPLVNLRMKHVTAMGGRFTTESQHVGDVKASALVKVFERGPHHVHLNAGLSLPTGEIRHRDDTPLGRVRLPYPMQTGSGTYDLMPGATYFGHDDHLSWGLQGIATIRTGRNSLGYRLGNRIEGNAWLAHPFNDAVSVSARASWTSWGNIVGEDDLLNPNLVPTADPNRRGGHRLDLLAGVNLYVPLGPLGKHRFALEAGFPAYQWLDGPQLETDWKVIVGWQLAFSGLLPGIGE